jgi:hypothetical protein
MHRTLSGAGDSPLLLTPMLLHSITELRSVKPLFALFSTTPRFSPPTLAKIEARYSFCAFLQETKMDRGQCQRNRCRSFFTYKTSFDNALHLRRSRPALYPLPVQYLDSLHQPSVRALGFPRNDLRNSMKISWEFDHFFCAGNRTRAEKITTWTARPGCQAERSLFFYGSPRATKTSTP